MKILIVLRVFAFFLFLFLPAIGFLMFAGFVLNSTYWFTWLGLPILLLNGIILLIQPFKRWIGYYLTKISRPA